MSSINQIISELAHSVKQADSVPVRNALRLSIIHARNKLLRESYKNHGYADKGLYQRIKLSLTDVPDGDLEELVDIAPYIKRTNNKVPRPTRFVNNTPFQSVRTVGYRNPIEIPFVPETVAATYKYLPGMCHDVSYDYINEYIYIFCDEDSKFARMNNVIVESVFEQPQLIETETSNCGENFNENSTDDNEFLIPEDIIEDLKQIVLANFNANVVRNTNEIPPITKVM